MGLVAMHSSWLAIDSIRGCTNGCKYCLFQATGENNCSPKIVGTPSEAIEELLNFKYYDKKIPLCLLPGTDAFLNMENIGYLKNLIYEIINRGIVNDLIFVTKCFIPDDFIELLQEVKNTGRNVVVYLSYSGLGEEIEPNVVKKDIESNFKRLKKANINIVHYFRPFLPQNSTPEKLQEILNFVNQYTDVSTIMGLKLIRNFVDRIRDIWPDLPESREKLLKADSIWPEEAWNYFYENYSHSQNLFQTNTCALNCILRRPSPQYFNSEECQSYNLCSDEQRELCAKSCHYLDRKSVIHRLYGYLSQLNIPSDEMTYCFDENGGIALKNIDLTISDLSYLSFMLNLKIHLTDSNPFDNAYNSSFNGAKPLVLKRVNSNERY